MPNEVDDVILCGRILRWGDSFGIRLRKQEAERAGLAPGADVTVKIARERTRIDLSSLPAFPGGDPEDSVRHDDLIGRAGRARRDT